MDTFKIEMNINRLSEPGYVNQLKATFAEKEDTLFLNVVVIIKLDGPDHFLKMEGLNSKLFDDLIDHYST